jgi:GAF domain-containing protein
MYPALQRGDSLLTNSSTVDATSSMVNGAILDITTVLKAATTISGEIVLAKLLRKLMDIVSENAGAQYGFLILEKNGELFIEAQSHEDKREASVLVNIPLTNCGLLAESIVKYVMRTGESVVINDARTDLRYEKDPFIIEHQPKSILALPVFNRGKFIGVLYLANNLTSGAFTQERIDLLSCYRARLQYL